MKSKKCHPKKMAKISAIDEERRMARMNSKHGKKMAKMSAKNEEDKMVGGANDFKSGECLTVHNTINSLLIYEYYLAEPWRREGQPLSAMPNKFEVGVGPKFLTFLEFTV